MAANKTSSEVKEETADEATAMLCSGKNCPFCPFTCKIKVFGSFRAFNHSIPYYVVKLLRKVYLRLFLYLNYSFIAPVDYFKNKVAVT
jgi:hypothetical protein